MLAHGPSKHSKAVQSQSKAQQLDALSPSDLKDQYKALTGICDDHGAIGTPFMRGKACWFCVTHAMEVPKQRIALYETVTCKP